MSIRSILAMLPQQDYELLTYAHEEGLTNQYVEYRPGRFVGVNVLPELMPHLVVEKTAGAYSAGSVLKPEAVAIFNGEK